jgi:rhodanese-related sulfurtransferase
MRELILDIRTKKEFCSGHICGAELIETPLPPLSELAIHKLRTKLVSLLRKLNLKKEDHIYLYCKKGIRANKASLILKNMGFENVFVLGGVEKGKLKSAIQTHKIKLCYCSF